MRAGEVRLVLALLAMAASGVRSHEQVATPPASASAVTITPPPPAVVLGIFVDDYQSRHVITATEWQHGNRAKYHIQEWYPVEQYAIAQNDEANPGEKGRWSRIDWMTLEGMPPYSWAYCLTAYDAPSADAARATPSARRDVPKTGCKTFPFTRMRRVD